MVLALAHEGTSLQALAWFTGRILQMAQGHLQD